MAGTKVGSAWYELRATDDRLKADLIRAEGAIRGSGTKAGTGFSQGFGTGLKGLTSQLTAAKGLVAAFVGGFVVTKIVSFFGDAVAAASNLNETVSKSSVVFGQDAMPALERWASTAAESFGQSKREALDAASTFAQFGKTAGLVGEDLIGFSTELTELASDLASFHNADPSEVIQAMGAAFRGESEPMARFGVDVRETNLRMIALQEGIISTNRTLTSGERVLAVQAALWRETKDEQGDYARTADGLANTQRSLNAQMEDLSAKIGEGLLPVMVTLARFASDTLVPALAGIVASFKDTEEGIGGFIAGVGRGVRNLDLLFGENGAVIRDWAYENGHNIEEAQRLVAQGMDDLNLTWEQATQRAKDILSGVPQAITDSTRQALADWKQADFAGMVAADLEAGAPAVAAGANAGITQPTQEELERNRQLAEESARAMTADYASEIAGGADNVEQAWEALLSGARNQMSETQRIADIHARLTAPTLRNALRSEDPYLRAQAVATKQTLLNELALLESGAIGHAVRTGKSLPDALASQQANTALQAGVLASRAVNALGTAPAAAGTAGSRTGSSFGSGIGSQYYYAVGKASGVAAGVRNTLSLNLYSGGYSSMGSWINGMTAAWYQRRATIDAIAAHAGNVFGRSLPRSGPIKGGLRSGGLSVGQSWTEGLIDGLSERMGEARGLLHLTGGVARAAAPSIASTSGGATTRNTSFGGITVNVYGYSGSPSETDNIARSLANSIRLRARSVLSY